MASRIASAVPGAEVVTSRLDQGYVFGRGGRGADAAASRPLLAACAAGPEDALVRAVAAWRPNVVVADATPWAPVLARAAGVPAAICSNFAWDDQYATLYAGVDEAASDVAAVRAQVAAFDLAIELPLGPGAPSVATRTPVPLIGRRPAGGAPALPPDRQVITWAFGRTPPDAQPLDGLHALARFAEERGYVLAANEGLRPVLDEALGASPAALLLPDDTPWPEVLAASRLVVSKAGYSTLAEALRGRAHLIAVGVTGLAEERAMQAELVDRGYGAAVPVEATDVAAAIEAAARVLLARPPREPNVEAGEGAILDALERLAG
ncbi:MAG: hypothetical protein AB7F65_09555 [Dehalococcoidia bacterium]